MQLPSKCLLTVDWFDGVIIDVDESSDFPYEVDLLACWIMFH